jgi:hypothetical protein
MWQGVPLWLDSWENELLEESYSGKASREGKEMSESTSNLHTISEEAGQEREARAAIRETGTGQPATGELETTCRAQHAVLQLIASGVQPSRGNRGPTMLTLREARAIAQDALRLYEEQPEDRVESWRSPAREAEQLRVSVLSGDLQGAKRQARVILERNEIPDMSDPGALLLRTFAQTLSGMLEGRVGVDVRHAVTSSLVRREQEAREAAERRAGQAERESAGLRRTLAWYANEANYHSSSGVGNQQSSRTAIDQDQGSGARQALDESEAGREVARRLEAAEKFIEHVKANLENYEQGISRPGTPD